MIVSLDIRQDWQEDTPIIKDISQVLGTMGIDHENHRLLLTIRRSKS
ncbi:MAG: hypothetical protein O3A81_02780 [bacterium]|nr:hypothetical protein [bacterium]